MSFVTALFIYIMIWWVALFAVLPWGNKHPDTPETGMMHGAPSRPHMKQKLIATSIIALIGLGIVYACMEANIIDFREVAREMDTRLYGERTVQ